MAIKIGDKIYRNLQEQVEYTTEAINNLKNLDVNIKILGKVENKEDLPSATTLNVGDCYAVSEDNPLEPLIYCVGSIKGTQSTNYWFMLGKLVGEKGEKGDAGPAGAQGIRGTLIFTGEGYPSGEIGINEDLYINTLNGDLLKKLDGMWNPIENLTGPQGPIGPAASVVEITGILPTEEQLPPPAEKLAYLVGGTDTGYDLYITIMPTAGQYEWKNIGRFNDLVGRDGESSIILNGANTPTPELGTTRDYYINTSNGDMYSKQTGSWTQISNIKGPKGDLPKTELLNLIYPVGSLYISTVNVSPETFLGGTWQSLGSHALLLDSINVTSGGVLKFFQGERDTSGELSFRLNKTLTSNPTTDEISNSDNFEIIHWRNTENIVPTSPMSYRSGIKATSTGSLSTYMWKRVA